ncbi:MAG: DUF454 domain-containing protein [Fibrobacter sp.]|nr:DUF454 domain-containing protein [Fibrobacter sp.]
MNKKQIVKILLISSGVLSLGIGLIGIVVPLLPTTPLLLLSAACFFRSSPKLYNWLSNHIIFGPYIRSYREHKAISIKTKSIAISLIWITLGISMIFVVDNFIIRILLALIGSAVTIHLVRFKTLTKEMLKQKIEKKTEPVTESEHN